MTDLSPTTDATVACTSCGAQNATQAVRCLDCGASLVATDISTRNPDAERGDLELEEEWRAAGVAGFDTDLDLETADHAICPVCGAAIALDRTPFEVSRPVRDTPTGRRDLRVLVLSCPSCATRERVVVDGSVLSAMSPEETAPDGAVDPDPTDQHHAAPSGATPDHPLGADRRFFEEAGPGTLKDQGPLLDEQGEDIRQYTGEPVESEEGWVLPQQQNVGIGNEAGGGEWPDPNAPSAQGKSRPARRNARRSED